jgi:K+-transporting ATPase KdpF subunit
MKTTVLLLVSDTAAGSLTPGYIVGGVLALLILFYLIYSLVKPEKF